MHYKVRVAEIEQAWSWRLRVGVIGGVVGDSLNEEVGTGNSGVWAKKLGRELERQ